MKIGRNVRSRMYTYEYEVEFCKNNGFDFLQIWYENGKLELLNESNPEEVIQKMGFPCIIHAMIYLDENFDKFANCLLEKVNWLHHNEVILHASCKEGENADICLLHDKIGEFCTLFNSHDITVHIENNDNSNKGIYQAWEFEKIINNNKIEILIDIVHALCNSDYSKIQEYTKIKFPKILHIADTPLDNLRHKHLAIGKGKINFERIFNEIIPNYSGRIIFEMLESDEDLIESKNKIKNIIKD